MKDFPPSVVAQINGTNCSVVVHEHDVVYIRCVDCPNFVQFACIERSIYKCSAYNSIRIRSNVCTTSKSENSWVCVTQICCIQSIVVAAVRHY